MQRSQGGLFDIRMGIGVRDDLDSRKRIHNKKTLRPLRLCDLCDVSSSVRQKRIGCGLRAVSLRLHFSL